MANHLHRGRNLRNFTTTNMKNGILCISLDFEKFWGVHDITTPQEQLAYFQNIDEIVQETLQLFSQYNVHATWATVGLLLDKNFPESVKNEKAFGYTFKTYSPFPLKHEMNEANKFLWNGEKAARSILNTSGQELASHTFSHLYSIEDGITKEDLERDLNFMNALEKDWEHRFKTIVFPRNQVNPEMLELLKNKNYLAFRGNQPNALWENSKYKNETRYQRGKRWADAYFGKSKTTFYKPQDLPQQNGLVNIPASRFFRPATTNKSLEKRKITKIIYEMQQAAEKGWVYHLWWHPHNFSNHTSLAFQQLKTILEAYKKLNSQYGFTSLNMEEIVQHVR